MSMNNSTESVQYNKALHEAWHRLSGESFPKHKIKLAFDEGWNAAMEYLSNKSKE